MFEKQIPADKLKDYLALIKHCAAAPIFGKFPISDIRYVCESAAIVNHEYDPTPMLNRLRGIEICYELHGEEVDHLAVAGTHCCKCPARVTCKARQDWLTNAFNTTDTQ